MKREEQIREASIDYQLSTAPRAIGGDAFSDSARKMNVNPSFIAGAKWMEKQMIEKACKWLEENFINECGYLGSGSGVISFNTKPAIDAFRKVMEE